MMDHPYLHAPDHAYWRRSFGNKAVAEIDPVVAFPFKISRQHKVVTAGSCFAQHISRYLKESGYCFLQTEQAHPVLSPEVAEKYSYGVFSARYGNIYTSRQLLQLMKRVYGEFDPADDIWRSGDRFIDPFRPNIQPHGFATIEEFKADRTQHLAAVRRAFEDLDVFVFTLGLTECWASRLDGSVYPLCPGVAGGQFDPKEHEFLNLSVNDVVTDMTEFISRLSAINSRAKIILTVSPVPLIATAEDRHVLVATTYSKSVLRVAAETMSRQFENVAYFPSFEVITGQFNRGTYYADDLRSITEDGVRHVMSLFFRHACVDPAGLPFEPTRSRPDDVTLREAERLVEVLCDEELIDDVGRR